MSLQLTPKALSEKPKSYELLIDGKWRAGRGEGTLDRVAPGHGSVVSKYAIANSEDTIAAITAARKAFDEGPWPKMTASERSRILNKTADLIEANKRYLAWLDSAEAGKPITQVLGEISGAVDIWRYAASLARTLYGESYNNLGENTLGIVLREPIGVVSIITPWNFPFLIASQKLPFALAAGCTAVVKPSQMSAGSTLELGRLLAEAGLPDGVVNIITGRGADVGSIMTSSTMVDMVSFTGSTGIGSATMAEASKTLKKVSLELGGKNPQILFPDADMDAFIDAAVFGGFFNAGECCNAGSRIIVHQDVADEVLARVIELSRKITVGDPLNEATKVGAIITPQHMQQIENAVAAAVKEGGEVVLGGNQLDLGVGQYLEPTIISGVRRDMSIASDEIFGPVLAVQKFGTIQEAIILANATSFGLSASVWSKDFDTCVKVARGAHAGTVWVNTFMDGTPELPFGGVKQSGLGRELGRHSVEDYTESKTLNMHTGPRTSWWLPR